MVLSLVGITFICSVCVAVVNQVTAEPIREANARAVEAALQAVLPEFDKLDTTQVEDGGFILDLYTAYNSDRVVGYAAKSGSMSGYAGLIELIVGIAPDGELLGVKVTKQSETPGLGAKIMNDDNAIIESIRGQNLNEFDLVCGADNGPVDALTGSTITTRAYLEAVEHGFEVLKKNVMKDE
ncbi:MAG: RnfABCDGE type electron transport complex subunit G [Rikenellaceae bacterium]